MNVADYIAVYLAQRKVTHVFELVGGMITVLLDALHRQNGITIVSMHHEQAAGFAAEGYGRMAGVPGVAMATSGPGATNLLTAIGSCYFDSVPCVFITGQVNRHELKGNRAIRQLGFQETDIISMAGPITKSCTLVTSPDEIPKLLDAAFSLACAGRPGPVLLDIPMDVQRANLSDDKIIICEPRVRRECSDIGGFIDRLKSGLSGAKRPLILAGGGVNSARARAQFQVFAAHLAVPVVNSLMAVDILPANDPLRVGLIGSYGNRWANVALSESDVLVVLGSRLDVRQTGSDTQSFKGGKQIFHVDCEVGELNNRVTGCDSLVCELPNFLSIAAERLSRGSVKQVWLRHIRDMRARWPDTHELLDVKGINPNSFMHRLAEFSRQAAAYVVDVGQHQMWAAQSIDIAAGQRFLTSGGMGAMGFALPTAIGAAFESDQPIVVIAGDGGFQLNIQELQTVARNRLPIKMVVLNNNSHGMVRQFQDSYFKGRVQSTVWGYSAPSFATVASAYGLRSRKLSEQSDIEASLRDLWEKNDEPFLLEVSIDLSANAYPKMAFGLPISEMEPLAKPTAMEST